MSTVPSFLALCNTHGSNATYHRDDSQDPCPCRTPEGVRDPIWHLQNPGAQMCNEAGFLPSGSSDVVIKGFVQPIQSTRATRLSTEELLEMFGTVEADDHLAIFPCEWSGVTINFKSWSVSGEDWIEYNGDRFTVVNANLIPDPSDGNPFHHWEVGLRMVNPVSL